MSLAIIPFANDSHSYAQQHRLNKHHRSLAARIGDSENISALSAHLLIYMESRATYVDRCTCCSNIWVIGYPQFLKEQVNKKLGKIDDLTGDALLARHHLFTRSA
jgi:hypothetical protein